MISTAIKFLLCTMVIFFVSSVKECSAGNSGEKTKIVNYYQTALKCEETGNNECMVRNYYLAFTFKQVPHDVYISKMEVYAGSVGFFVINNEDKVSPIDLWDKYRYLHLALFSAKTLNPNGSTVEATLFIFLIRNLKISYICTDWEAQEKRIQELISSYSNWADFENIETHNLQFVHEKLVSTYKENRICDESSVDKNILLKLFEN